MGLAAVVRAEGVVGLVVRDAREVPELLVGILRMGAAEVEAAEALPEAGPEAGVRAPGLTGDARESGLDGEEARVRRAVEGGLVCECAEVEEEAAEGREAKDGLGPGRSVVGFSGL